MPIRMVGKQEYERKYRMKKFIYIILSVLIVLVSLCGCGEKHDGCLLVGYANPDLPLRDNTLLLQEPKYGYEAVFWDPSDPSSPNFKYHFH